MAQIQELIVFLQVLVAIGAGYRGVQCAILLSNSDDDAPSVKKRLRNLLIFTVLAETISGFINVILSYFGGSV